LQVISKLCKRLQNFKAWLNREPQFEIRLFDWKNHTVHNPKDLPDILIQAKELDSMERRVRQNKHRENSGKEYVTHSVSHPKDWIQPLTVSGSVCCQNLLLENLKETAILITRPNHKETKQ